MFFPSHAMIYMLPDGTTPHYRPTLIKRTAGVLVRLGVRLVLMSYKLLKLSMIVTVTLTGIAGFFIGTGSIVASYTNASSMPIWVLYTGLLGMCILAFFAVLGAVDMALRK